MHEHVSYLVGPFYPSGRVHDFFNYFLSQPLGFMHLRVDPFVFIFKGHLASIISNIVCL
jgi:hypothetical protein